MKILSFLLMSLVILGSCAPKNEENKAAEATVNTTAAEGVLLGSWNDDCPHRGMDGSLQSIYTFNGNGTGTIKKSSYGGPMACSGWKLDPDYEIEFTYTIISYNSSTRAVVLNILLSGSSQPYLAQLTPSGSQNLLLDIAGKPVVTLTKY